MFVGLHDFTWWRRTNMSHFFHVMICRVILRDTFITWKNSYMYVGLHASRDCRPTYLYEYMTWRHVLIQKCRFFIVMCRVISRDTFLRKKIYYLYIICTYVTVYHVVRVLVLYVVFVMPCAGEWVPTENIILFHSVDLLIKIDEEHWCR